MSDDLRLVVGLGNPGSSYAGNRHNVGFMVVDVLAARVGARFGVHKNSGGRAEIAEGRLGPLPGARVALVKPRSYMNESGGPVSSVAAWYRVPPEHIVVVHDELDLPYGTLRMKQGGGDNGHNGLRSLTRSLGSREYLRLRFGVGRPPGRVDPADFVLRDFSTTERKDLGVLIEQAVDALEELVLSGLAAAQNRYHS
jgi:PTH1 family peptidyl-tRNA hydrolase